jgi:AcrR family transcriptional regulator
VQTPQESRPLGPKLSRKSASVSRNRAAIIASTQVTLGEKGWQATIEEVAQNAGVSVSTIYQHFESKNSLFETCVLDGWATFEDWALGTALDIEDPLEQLVVPMRLSFRSDDTHPILARVLMRNMAEAYKLAPKLNRNLGSAIAQMASAGLLPKDNVPMRVANLWFVLYGIIVTTLENRDADPALADFALSLALPMIGISPETARDLTTRPLPIAASVS